EEAVAPKSNTKSRQNFFDLAHNIFRNGAKIKRKWREFAHDYGAQFGQLSARFGRNSSNLALQRLPTVSI
ncbi:hypothetical protein, partial [Porphyromonas loveana]|uniref:hypothetical protein n=1 Tax=Porphyromonas loveana TaxID=1884669 RepID=UPI0035A0C437